MARKPLNLQPCADHGDTDMRFRYGILRVREIARERGGGFWCDPTQRGVVGKEILVLFLKFMGCSKDLAGWLGRYITAVTLAECGKKKKKKKKRGRNGIPSLIMQVSDFDMEYY